MRTKKNFQNLHDTLKVATAAMATMAVSTGIVAITTQLYNRAQNNREIVTASQTTVSRVNGISGHTEFTKFANGSYDVRVYPSIGHRYGSSELDQDLNGDHLVDRIRINSSVFHANKLDKLLVRDSDYDANQDLFTKADKRLNQLIQSYVPNLD